MADTCTRVRACHGWRVQSATAPHTRAHNDTYAHRHTRTAIAVAAGCAGCYGSGWPLLAAASAAAAAAPVAANF